MQPLPPSGPPSGAFAPIPARPLSPGQPAPADRVELASRSGPGPLIPAGMTRPSPPPADASPRPWPLAPEQRPLSSALTLLNGQRSSQVSAQLTPMGLAGLALEQLPGQLPANPWDPQPTPEGWKLPKNPDPAPLRARDLFELKSPEDLGPLQLVPSLCGKIRQLRLQWPEEFVDPAFSAQRALFQDVLGKLPGEVQFQVVVEGLAAARLPQMLRDWNLEFEERMHFHPLHLHSTPQQVYLPMTMWARDGAILLHTQEGRPVLVLPKAFRGDGQVDPQLNRLRLQGSGAAPALFSQTLPQLEVRRSHLQFEGGDLVASRQHVLLGGQSLARTVQECGLSRQEALAHFGQLLGKKVVVIEPQPDFHLDLGFTFLDEETIAVADPEESLRRLPPSPEQAIFARCSQEKHLPSLYHQAARRLQEMGFRVVRLPGLAGLGLVTPYPTYNNVLMEDYVENAQRVRRVYLPVYGLDPLDDWARDVYTRAGFSVVAMASARDTTRLWGALRCATGELEISHLS